VAEDDPTEEKRGGRVITIRRTVTIRRPAAELHRFWRDLRNLKELLPDAVRVTEKSKNRAHWKVRAPGGKTLEWNTEIVEDRPGRAIAWESCPDADIANSGSVHFEPRSEERESTKVKVEIRYRPPGGLLGAAVAKAVRGRASEEMARGLRRVKERLESQPPAAKR
jgi:uncharacterized membrane protein